MPAGAGSAARSAAPSRRSGRAGRGCEATSSRVTSAGSREANSLRVREATRKSYDDRLALGGLRVPAALELAPGLGEEHVVERRRVQLEVGDGQVLGVQRADDRRERLGAAASAAPPPRRAAPATAAEAREHGGDRRASAPLARARPRASGGRSRPSAPPACPRRRCARRSMIPTRSARTSASSRYCVVRNTVTPSSRARCATSAHMSARLGGSRPGRRLVEEQDPRVVHERQREVEPALHAARVAADLAVGGVGEADALEQLVAAAAALGLAARPAAPSAGACARGR